MGTPFLAEIKIVAFNFAPKGWAQCNGQFLPINQNQALFSILGTTYGGNGQTTFALPDFRGRVPMHAGRGFTLGEKVGQDFHTVTISELPAHTHGVQCSSLAESGVNTNTPALNFPANDPVNAYRTTFNTTLFPGSVSNVGGSQPHENRQPYSVLLFCIALQGVFPSQT